MLVMVVLFIGAMMSHNKHNKQLRTKLYNFKKAPKNYVDEDSFININDI